MTGVGLLPRPQHSYAFQFAYVTSDILWIRMFASRTIILADRALLASAQLLKFGYQTFFFNIRQCLGKTVRCSLEFGKIG